MDLTWEREGSDPGPDLILFRARFDRLRNPRTGKTLRAVVLESPDWTNVVARTPEGRYVVVRQQRFGTGAVTTEIPAGIVDPGESSGEAASRELAEETGYTSDAWTYLGFVEPNPAFLTNRCHHWLAENAVPTGAPRLDEGENIEVLELDEAGIRRELSSGRMRHALAVSALSHVLDLRVAPPARP